MAGRFRIFNEPASNVSIAPNKGREQLHSSTASKIKTTGAAGLVPSKSTENLLFKPKGLSVRSKSDLNVFISSTSGANKPISKDNLKLNEKQGHLSKPLSPFNKLKSPKKQLLTNVPSKKLSPKISSPIVQNVADDFVFKKPATPKPKQSLECPEPERLASDFDIVKYMDDEMKAIFEADLAFVKAAAEKYQSKSFTEDEGFYSDSEPIPWEADSDSSFYGDSLPIFDSSDIPPPPLPDISDSDDE